MAIRLDQGFGYSQLKGAGYAQRKIRIPTSATYDECLKIIEEDFGLDKEMYGELMLNILVARVDLQFKTVNLEDVLSCVWIISYEYHGKSMATLFIADYNIYSS